MTLSIRRFLMLGAVTLGLAATSAKAESQFALGLQIGAAGNTYGTSNFSGLTARVGQEKTIEGVLAFDRSTWILNGNYLVHSRSLFHQDPINFIKFYGGFGVGVWTGGDGGVWAQVPLGVDFRFAIPVELSMYLAPGMDVVPETRANWHFGIGLRYWFL